MGYVECFYCKATNATDAKKCRECGNPMLKRLSHPTVEQLALARLATMVRKRVPISEGSGFERKPEPTLPDGLAIRVVWPQVLLIADSEVLEALTVREWLD